MILMKLGRAQEKRSLLSFSYIILRKIHQRNSLEQAKRSENCWCALISKLFTQQAVSLFSCIIFLFRCRRSCWLKVCKCRVASSRLVKLFKRNKIVSLAVCIWMMLILEGRSRVAVLKSNNKNTHYSIIIPLNYVTVFNSINE